MRVRLIHCKKNLIDYDILTQFIIKNKKDLPNITSCEIQMNSVSHRDIKISCFNLVSIQLLGGRSSKYFLNNLKFKSRLTGISNYIFLETLLLIAYKNKSHDWNIFCKNSFKHITIISMKNFLCILEYLFLYSNFIKLLEKIPNVQFDTKFQYRLDPPNRKFLNYYLLKSMNYPF